MKKYAVLFFFFLSALVFLNAHAFVQQVAGGNEFYCALLDTNEVKCWGSNIRGQLGNGTAVTAEGRKFFKVDLGTNEKILQLAGSGRGFSSCVLFESGRVKCWGLNSFGQLGLGDSIDRGSQPNQMGVNLPYVDLGTIGKVVRLALGERHACALIDVDGVKKMKCWGSGISGSLGSGSSENVGTKAGQMGDKLPFIKFGANDKLIDISASSQNSCALFEGGKIKCWGTGVFGALARGDSNSYGSRADETPDKLAHLDLGSVPVSKVELGGTFACAILTNGKVKCWGKGNYGQLGLGSTEDRGMRPNQMGENLPTLDFGTNEKVTDLSLSENHGCAIFESGRMKCWGIGEVGCLGTEDNTARGDTPESMKTLPFVNLGQRYKVVGMASPFYSNCVLLAPVREIKCFGYNDSGQLGDGARKSIGAGESQMGDNLQFVDLY